MSTKFNNRGTSHNTSFGGRDERTPTTLEEWMLEEKRFEERLHYYERMQYHCTIIGSRGFEIKCKKDCFKCSYFWSKKPNKVSIEQLAEAGIEVASSDETPIQYAERMEKEEKVQEAIDSLPSEDLKVVARMFADSCSFSEIGRALGISKQAAHKKWEKAKEHLRAKLQGYWNSINS